MKENYINENAEETVHMLATSKELQSKHIEVIKRKLALEERIEDSRRKVKGIQLSNKDITGELSIIAFYRRQQKTTTTA